MSERQQAMGRAQPREEVLEIEMPEGPQEAGADEVSVEAGSVTIRSRSGRQLESVTPIPGERLADTLARIQREQNGAGAVYVISLEAT